jgi:hypothetical protein
VTSKEPDDQVRGAAVGLLGEHSLDRLAGGPPAERDVADRGYLVGIERQVLGLEVPSRRRRMLGGNRLRLA